MDGMLVYVSIAIIYEYEGWKFEFDERKPFGPWPLKNDLEPRKRAGNKFYAMFSSFSQMSKEKQCTFRI